MSIKNKLKVVFLCENMFDNPYLQLLTQGLNAKDVSIEENFGHVILFFNILKTKADLIHLQTLHYYFLGRNKIHRTIKFYIFIVQLFLLKIIGIKSVWTVHEWSDKFEGGKRNLSRIQAVILGKVLSAIICHCDSTKQEMIQALSLSKQEKKIFVVNHGNYVGYFPNKISSEEARKNLGINQNEFVFLLFGTVQKSKGFLRAIAAFKELKVQSNISLLIVGYPAEKDIEDAIYKKIEHFKNIIFVPKRVEDDKIQTYMNASDCVVFPYEVFTTSGALILAMTFAKACIAPKQGYFGDILDESGTFFFDSKQEDSLMDAMKRATYKNNDLEAMGQHNFNLIQPYDWNYVGQKTLEIYQGCLSN